MESEMLKRIIQDDDPAFQLFKGDLAHPIPVRPCQDGDTWKMPGQQVRLVRRRRWPTEHPPAIADDHWLSGTTPIPSQDDRHAVTLLVQPAGEHLDERGLSGPASDQVF